MGPKIVVGMSGGVDSAVAAMLLKEQGYDVQCIFMKNWEDEADNPACSSEADYVDALQAAEVLDLPLHSVNFSKEYWENVFTYFLDEYRAGRTPNPDVLCNREIKFKVFLDYALKLGADKIATGHYARVRENGNSVQLLKGKDTGKDQSYFLYLLTQKALQKVLFPLGDLTKPEVRALAQKAGLPNAKKKDSTGICFIGERKFSEFLATYIPAKPGDIVDMDGKIFGHHNGLMFYTLGQRQGLGIGGKKGAPELPWYVAEKRLDKNELVVVQGQKNPALYSTGLAANQVHWIEGSPPKIDQEYTAKVRYRQSDQTCRIIKQNESGIEIEFAEPQFAVAPGQSVVLYRDDVCLGGAIIEKAATPQLQEATH